MVCFSMEMQTIEDLEQFAERKSFVSIFAKGKLWIELLEARGKLAPFSRKQIKSALVKKDKYLGQWYGRDCYIEGSK